MRPASATSVVSSCVLLLPAGQQLESNSKCPCMQIRHNPDLFGVRWALAHSCVLHMLPHALDNLGGSHVMMVEAECVDASTSALLWTLLLSRATLEQQPGALSSDIPLTLCNPCTAWKTVP